MENRGESKKLTLFICDKNFVFIQEGIKFSIVIYKQMASQYIVMTIFVVVILFYMLVVLLLIHLFAK